MRRIQLGELRSLIKTPTFGTENVLYVTNKPSVLIATRVYATNEKIESPPMIDIPKGTVVAISGCGKLEPEMSTVCYDGYWGQISSKDLDHYANTILERVD